MKKILIMLIGITYALTFPALATEQWREDGSESTVQGTESPSDIDTEIYNNIVSPADRLLAQYREGCKLVYAAAASLTIEDGQVMASNSGGTARLMLSNTSDTTATFSNLDTGSEASSTTYYVYAGTSTTSDTTFTVYISASASAPSGVTYYKRLGSFYNNASSDIEQVANDNEDLPIDARIKGWIQFNGTGTIAIQDSYNVTSITDNGTGDYTVTWDTDFANNDYCVVLGTRQTAESFASNGCIKTMAVGSTRVATLVLGTLTDCDIVCVAVIGDQ